MRITYTTVTRVCPEFRVQPQPETLSPQLTWASRVAHDGSYLHKKSNQKNRGGTICIKNIYTKHEEINLVPKRGYAVQAGNSSVSLLD